MVEDQKLPKLAYSVPEFARAHGLSENLIWRELATGELESCLVGDRRLITPEQAQRWHRRKEARAREKRARQRDAGATPRGRPPGIALKERQLGPTE